MAQIKEETEFFPIDKFNGVNEYTHPSILSPNQFVKLQNMQYHNDILKARYGTEVHTQWSGSYIGKCFVGITAGKGRIIVAEKVNATTGVRTLVWNDDGLRNSGWSDVVDEDDNICTLAGMHPLQFENFQNKIWITDGFSDVVVFDGYFYKTLTEDAMKGKYMVQFANHLFFLNTIESPFNIIRNRLSDDDGNAVETDTNDAWNGDYINAIPQTCGIIGARATADKILVYGRNGVFGLYYKMDSEMELTLHAVQKLHEIQPIEGDYHDTKRIFVIDKERKLYLLDGRGGQKKVRDIDNTLAGITEPESSFLLIDEEAEWDRGTHDKTVANLIPNNLTLDLDSSEEWTGEQFVAPGDDWDSHVDIYNTRAGQTLSIVSSLNSLPKKCKEIYVRLHWLQIFGEPDNGTADLNWELREYISAPSHVDGDVEGDDYEVIASGTDIAVTFPAGTAWHNFTINEILKEGTTYMIVLEAENRSAVGRPCWTGYHEGGYSGGSCYDPTSEAYDRGFRLIYIGSYRDTDDGVYISTGYHFANAINYYSFNAIYNELDDDEALTIQIQISTDGATWYSVAEVQDAWTTITVPYNMTPINDLVTTYEYIRFKLTLENNASSACNKSPVVQAVYVSYQIVAGNIRSAHDADRDYLIFENEYYTIDEHGFFEAPLNNVQSLVIWNNDLWGSTNAKYLGDYFCVRFDETLQSDLEEGAKQSLSVDIESGNIDLRQPGWEKTLRRIRITLPEPNISGTFSFFYYVDSHYKAESVAVDKADWGSLLRTITINAPEGFTGEFLQWELTGNKKQVQGLARIEFEFLRTRKVS